MTETMCQRRGWVRRVWDLSKCVDAEGLWLGHWDLSKCVDAEGLWLGHWDLSKCVEIGKESCWE